MTDHKVETFEQYQGLLFAIAYRMLGSATHAEDIVQEAYLRWRTVDEEEVLSSKAYLSTIVVRLCIDHLRSAQSQRELYVGPWLPEPLPTDAQRRGVDSVVRSESLSFAFLILLERLSPVERAVFLLREGFDYDYAEIADMVGKREANCRQILRRARQHLGQERSRFEVPYQQHERITEQFLHASTSGEMQGLLDLLTEDVVFIADSGGKTKTSRRPVQGRDKVARGLRGGLRSLPPQTRVMIEEINAQPALVAYTATQPIGVMLLELEDGQVRTIYAVVNPDKLHGVEQKNDRTS